TSGYFSRTNPTVSSAEALSTRITWRERGGSMARSASRQGPSRSRLFQPTMMIETSMAPSPAGSLTSAIFVVVPERLVVAEVVREIQVFLDDALRGPVGADLPLVQPDGAPGDAADVVHIVRDEDDRDAPALEFGDFAVALLLKSFVTHREDLIHEQDVRARVSGDGKTEPQHHPLGVGAQRRPQRAAQLAEGDDLLQPRRDLLAIEPHDRAVQ